MQQLQNHTGSEILTRPIGVVALLMITAVVIMGFVKFDLVGGLVLVGLPMVVIFLFLFFKNPEWGIIGAFVIGFFTSGVIRYIDAPLGLLIDIFLIMSWLVILLKKKENKWQPIKNDLMLVSLLWFAFVVFELINPEMVSSMAWFYSMRATGFYQILTFGLVFMLCRHPKYLDIFLKWLVIFSILGSLWGLKQMFIGTDAAENAWLHDGMNAKTHILHGVLRVFSFYSDAGQFGASQAMVALVCGILFISPISNKKRVFFGIGFLFTFIGFAISGTRGALAVPGVGGIMYLLISRNFKLLTVGMIVVIGMFCFLKFTYALQHVEQVRRMRTALDPSDPSLQVRLQNQITFGNYLRTRPFGGGIGSVGYWGYRFSPHTLLANTATDSYFVKIWAETGIVGICLHFLMFGYFIGKGGLIVWYLKNPQLKAKIAALVAALCGVLMASYGNQVFCQMPTGIILYIAIPFIFLAPEFDKILLEEEKMQTC